jgi:hypothetical protein
MPEKIGSNEEQLGTTEGAFTYHTVSHSHSHTPDIRPKFACARTKAEAIILNMYEPHALSVLHYDLEKAEFISVLTDTSSHKEISIFPVIVMYFDYKTEVKIKILDLKSLPGETSVIVIK